MLFFSITCKLLLFFFIYSFTLTDLELFWLQMILTILNLYLYYPASNNVPFFSVLDFSQFINRENVKIYKKCLKNALLDGKMTSLF